MEFPPEVEQWRPLVQRYFPAELVDKALWVIQWESGGDPGAVGDGGAARGLFQIQDSRNFPSRPDAAYLDNPENNIAYAAQQLGAASGNFSDWGENNLYQGKPFGALGNHPFPGGSSSGGARVSTAGGVGARERMQSKATDLPLDPALQRWMDANPAPKPESHPAGTSVTRRGVEGDPLTRLRQLTELSEQSWVSLDEYIMGSGDILVPDTSKGVVWKIDEFGEIAGQDAQGTKLLQAAISYDTQADLIAEGFDSGIYQTGEASAAAALNASKERAGEAERAYADTMTRIGDIFNIEKAEGQRADQIRGAALDAQEGIARHKELASQGIAAPRIDFRFPGQESGKEFRTGIRKTLPQEIPAFQPVDQGAINTAYGQGQQRVNYDGSPVEGDKIPLGPAGFTPESYIQNYLIPNIQPVGSAGFRAGVLDN